MVLPFFYKEDIIADSETIILDEETSKHMVQVLRMKKGDQLNLTNGLGSLYVTEIIDDHKKKCVVKLLSTINKQPSERKITIAISLIKNTNRFEWFLEKATEIGVTEIIPLVCERTEKKHFRTERMKSILISAMLQSQQCRLPVMSEPRKFDNVISSSTHQQKFIAHCIESEKRNLIDLINKNLSSQIILIGPEGDFTTTEIELAIRYRVIPVALGDTRLRTETAGIFAASLLCNI